LVGSWLLVGVVDDFLLHLDCLDLFVRRPTLPGRNLR
jgi:hypothetical protein